MRNIDEIIREYEEKKIDKRIKEMLKENKNYILTEPIICPPNYSKQRANYIASKYRKNGQNVRTIKIDGRLHIVPEHWIILKYADDNLRSVIDKQTKKKLGIKTELEKIKELSYKWEYHKIKERKLFGL
jgi:hypothetical protein